jgi:hypothetical protein
LSAQSCCGASAVGSGRLPIVHASDFDKHRLEILQFGGSISSRCRGLLDPCDRMADLACTLKRIARKRANEVGAGQLWESEASLQEEADEGLDLARLDWVALPRAVAEDVPDDTENQPLEAIRSVVQCPLRQGGDGRLLTSSRPEVRDAELASQAWCR